MQTATEFAIQTPEQRQDASRWIFFAGDLIDQVNKVKLPELRNGGIFAPGALTLAYRNGFIERCKVIPLRQAMQTSHPSQIHPERRADWTRVYEVVDGNGVKTIGYDAAGQWDGMLRRAVYPAADAVSLTAQQIGIVEMPVKTELEAIAAQAFLLPQPFDNFPPTIAHLRRYFEKRAAAARNPFESAVAAAAIESCDQITALGVQVVADTRRLFEEARNSGNRYVVRPADRAFFRMLGEPTPDEAARSNDTKLDRLTDTLEGVFSRLAGGAAVSTVPAAPEPPQPDLSPAAAVTQPTETVAETSTGSVSGKRGLVDGREVAILKQIGKTTTAVRFDDGEEKVVKTAEIEVI